MPLVKGHETTSRRGDDVPCMTADAVALYQRLKTCRYADSVSRDCGSFVECGPTITPHSPAIKGVKTILQDPSKGTHTRLPEGSRKTKVKANARARARDKRMKT